MEEIREAIGIEKVDMNEKFILIEENHGTDANFVLQAMISHCRNKNHNICLVLFHNTFGHLHNTGMKLGYDLRKEYNSTVRVVEPLKILSKNIYSETNDNNKFLEFDITKNNIDLVKQLVQLIEDECKLMKEDKDKEIFIIIDDLSHLFNIGLSCKDVWLFIRHIRSFVSTELNCTLCISSHVYKVNQETCESNTIVAALRYFADLVIIIQPLETGFSKSVSGKLIVCWKSHERLQFKWPEETIYMYKLFDRQVKLFEPGSVPMLYK